jgi:hypothetical protein
MIASTDAVCPSPTVHLRRSVLTGIDAAVRANETELH